MCMMFVVGQLHQADVDGYLEGELVRQRAATQIYRDGGAIVVAHLYLGR